MPPPDIPQPNNHHTLLLAGMGVAILVIIGGLVAVSSGVFSNQEQNISTEQSTEPVAVDEEENQARISPAEAELQESLDALNIGTTGEEITAAELEERLAAISHIKTDAPTAEELQARLDALNK